MLPSMDVFVNLLKKKKKRENKVENEEGNSYGDEVAFEAKRS